MRKSAFILASIVAITFACASRKGNVSTSHPFLGSASQDTETKFLDENSFLITQSTEDKSYGYAKSNPIKVGGRTGSGPQNQRRFLNGLLGPDGQKLIYYRAGSCCPFKTPNGLFDNTGMLDIYRVTWVGASDTLSLYINLYDHGQLYVPVGFTGRQN